MIEPARQGGDLPLFFGAAAALAAGSSQEALAQGTPSPWRCRLQGELDREALGAEIGVAEVGRSATRPPCVAWRRDSWRRPAHPPALDPPNCSRFEGLSEREVMEPLGAG